MNHRTRLKRRNARFAGAFYRDDASKRDFSAAARWRGKMIRLDRRRLAWLHRIGASPLVILAHRLRSMKLALDSTANSWYALQIAAGELGKTLERFERLKDCINLNVELPLSWGP